MGWLAGLGFVALFCMLFAAVPAFRSFILILVVGAGALVFWLIDRGEKQKVQAEAQVRLARTQIRADELLFTNLTLGESYGMWKLRGTVQNNGGTDLIAFAMRLTVQDCATNCVTIGDEVVAVSPFNVPPAQARAFEQSVRFPNMPTPKSIRWSYTIPEVYGRPR